MVRAKSGSGIDTVAEVYCHVCSQLAGETIHHTPPKCDEPAKESATGTASPSADDPFSGCIIDPVSGEVIDPADPTYIDDLIDSYERLDAQDKKIYAAKCVIRQALANLTEGDTKTRRVAGKRRLAKLEMPSDKYEQSILKEAWQAYPQFRDEYLRIESIAPKLRELKKLENTSGDAALTTFRDMVCGANNGPGGALPTIKIER